jgi:hypothetical protein
MAKKAGGAMAQIGLFYALIFVGRDNGRLPGRSGF